MSSTTWTDPLFTCMTILYPLFLYWCITDFIPFYFHIRAAADTGAPFARLLSGACSVNKQRPKSLLMLVPLYLMISWIIWSFRSSGCLRYKRSCRLTGRKSGILRSLPFSWTPSDLLSSMSLYASFLKHPPYAINKQWTNKLLVVYHKYEICKRGFCKIMP